MSRDPHAHSGDVGPLEARKAAATGRNPSTFGKVTAAYRVDREACGETLSTAGNGGRCSDVQTAKLLTKPIVSIDAAPWTVPAKLMKGKLTQRFPHILAMRRREPVERGDALDKRCQLGVVLGAGSDQSVRRGRLRQAWLWRGRDL